MAPFTDFKQLYNNPHNSRTIHTTVQQFTQLYNNSHNYKTIHTNVQQFTQLYNNSHNCTTIHTTLQQLTVATNWDERDFFNSATLNVHIVLQGSKLVVEFVILLKNGKTHFVNRPSQKSLFTLNIIRSLISTQCAMQRTQFEETDFSAENGDVPVDEKGESLFE